MGPSLVALLLAAAGPAAPAATGGFEDRRQESREVALHRSGRWRVTADLHLGSITLKGWTREAVLLEALVVGQGPSPVEALRGRNGSALEVKTYRRHIVAQSRFFGLADWHKAWYYIRRGERPGRIDLTITAPPRVRVRAYVAYGSILVDGFAGRVSVRTVDGPIRARRASGHLVAENQSGDVVLEGLAAKVRVRSRTGTVRVLDHTGQTDVRTQSGPVLLDLADPGLADQWVSTDSGAVEVRVPAGKPIRMEHHGPTTQVRYLLRTENHQRGHAIHRAETARPLTYVDVRNRHGPTLFRESWPRGPEGKAPAREGGPSARAPP